MGTTSAGGRSSTWRSCSASAPGPSAPARSAGAVPRHRRPARCSSGGGGASAGPCGRGRSPSPASRVVWVAGQGWLPAPSRPRTAARPCRVGLALAAGLGMTAFEVDLPDYHFGWRQIVSLLAGAAFVLAMLPGARHRPLGPLGPARAATTTDSLQFLDQQVAGGAVPHALAGRRRRAPAVGLAPRRARASTTSDPTAPWPTPPAPTARPRWPSSGRARRSRPRPVSPTPCGSAGEGGTTRLGVAPRPDGDPLRGGAARPRPRPLGGSASYDPANLVAALEAQLDLSEVTVNPGVRVFENAAWGPQRALLPAGTTLPQGGASLADQTIPALKGAPVAAARDPGLRLLRGSGRLGVGALPGRRRREPLEAVGRRHRRRSHPGDGVGQRLPGRGDGRGEPPLRHPGHPLAGPGRPGAALGPGDRLPAADTGPGGRERRHRRRRGRGPPRGGPRRGRSDGASSPPAHDRRRPGPGLPRDGHVRPGGRGGGGSRAPDHGRAGRRRGATGAHGRGAGARGVGRRGAGVRGVGRRGVGVRGVGRRGVGARGAGPPGRPVRAAGRHG